MSDQFNTDNYVISLRRKDGRIRKSTHNTKKSIVDMAKEEFEDTKEVINIRKSKWTKEKGQSFCYNN